MIQLMFVLLIINNVDYSKHSHFDIFDKQMQIEYDAKRIYAIIFLNFYILYEFLIGYLDAVLIQELDG